MKMTVEILIPFSTTLYKVGLLHIHGYISVYTFKIQLQLLAMIIGPVIDENKELWF